jgi:hypothetical protein
MRPFNCFKLIILLSKIVKAVYMPHASLPKKSTHYLQIYHFSIFLTYRVHMSFCWLKSVPRFQRRRFKCEKLTDGRRTLTHDKSSHGLWPGELKIRSPNGDSCCSYISSLLRYSSNCCFTGSVMFFDWILAISLTAISSILMSQLNRRRKAKRW